MITSTLTHLVLLPLSVTPTPSPSPSTATDGTPSQQAAPGLWAFVAFLFLAIALWLLMRNMNSRLRRMSYRNKAAGDSTVASDAVVQRDGGGDVVRDEGQDREGVEDLVNPNHRGDGLGRLIP